MVPENHLSFHRASTARLNLAAGTLPSFYLFPKRASKNNSKASRGFRPLLSLTTGHGMPIKLHQQASHRFQSNMLNRDMHTKPAANYTKDPASAQRPWGSKCSSMKVLGTLRLTHSNSHGSHGHHSQIFKEKQLSLTQYIGIQKKRGLFFLSFFLPKKQPFYTAILRLYFLA